MAFTPAPLLIFPERFFLIAQNGHAAVVTRAVVRDGGEKGYRQPRFFRALGDPLAPVRMHLS